MSHTVDVGGREVDVPDGLTVYDVTSPSDRAHLAIKGEPQAYDVDDSDATLTARTAAFDLGSPSEDQSQEDRAQELEDAKEAAGIGSEFDGDEDEEDPHDEDNEEDNTGGVGRKDDVQGEAEAIDAEQKRRDEMSEVELEEAATRDRIAADFSGDEAEIPQVGSPDDESRADQNDDVKDGV